MSKGYRRTVLVIWPKYADFLITGHGDLESACLDLYGILSKTPTQDERAQIEFLMTRIKAPEDAVHVADGVCRIACQWEDVELWKRVVEVCSKKQGLNTLDVESICTAISTFGFDAIKPR